MRTYLNIGLFLWAVLTGFDPGYQPVRLVVVTVAAIEEAIHPLSIHPCAIRECEGR